MANNHEQAMAKLVGHNWEHYMTQQEIVLGRGGKDVICDVVVSKETAVSRKHFAIRYVPELQAFEIKNLSKNGILINGDFTTLATPPRFVRSQAEIQFGKHPHMRCAFILHAEMDRNLNGTNGKQGAKHGGKKEGDKKSQNRNAQVKLLNLIGNCMVLEDSPMTLEQVSAVLQRRFKDEVNYLLPDLLQDSLRHMLNFNANIFETTEPAPPGGGGRAVANQPARFLVRREHRAHFHNLANLEHLHGLTTPNGSRIEG